MSIIEHNSTYKEVERSKAQRINIKLSETTMANLAPISSEDRTHSSTISELINERYKIRCSFYVWEKFYQATLCLSGLGSIEDRLYSAISVLRRLNENNFKRMEKEIGIRFEELMQSMKKVSPIGEEGRIMATIRSMDELELHRISEEIVSLYDCIAKNYGNVFN